MSLRSVCVFCGSRSGRNPAHGIAARHTGEMLARRGWRLVFGAGEVLTWAQIGLHGKPILLLDVEGYWQPLLRLLDHVIAEGFADASLLQHFRAVADVPALEAALTEAFA